MHSLACPPVFRYAAGMMEKRRPVVELRNEIEARLLQAHLESEQIPHVVVSRHDAAYTGIFQVQLGWGHVETPDEYASRVREIYDDMFGESEPKS
jgi:hypothetical protein